MTKPDTISIVCRDEEEISADSADLLVQVEGSSVFSGNEAFKKAAEVKQLVGQLKEIGVEENKIMLRSIDMSSSAFSLVKASSARYWIKIGDVGLEILPKVLGSIGDQKNCTMSRLDWNYGAVNQARTMLRAKVLEQTLTLAKQDAECLGVELLGIHNLNEEFRDGFGASVSREFPVGAKMKRAKTPSKTVDLDFALGNSTKLTVTLNAEFRVSPMSTAEDG